jgi:hypothetical protein
MIAPNQKTYAETRGFNFTQELSVGNNSVGGNNVWHEFVAGFATCYETLNSNELREIKLKTSYYEKCEKSN